MISRNLANVADHDPGRINRREPQPTLGFPRMPSDLNPVAQRVWRHVARTMGPTGVITGADSDVLHVFCETVARYRQAEFLLAQSGPLIVAKGNGSRRGELVKNPLAQIVRDNADLLRAFARELGLTPAARATLAGDPVSERDEFATFLDGEDAGREKGAGPDSQPIRYADGVSLALTIVGPFTVMRS